jgi:type III secretory pathway component EscV
MVVDEPFRVTVRAPEALHAGLSPAAADRVGSALSGVLDELGASRLMAVDLVVGPRIELEAGGHVCGCPDELVTRARAYTLGSAALGGDDDHDLSREASDELLELTCGTLLAEHPGLLHPHPPRPVPDAIELLVEPGYLRELSHIGAMAENFPFMRDGLFVELGLRLPPILLVPDETLRPRAFAVRIGHKRAIPLMGLPDGTLLVNDTKERLELMALGGTYETAWNPATWQPGTLARGADANALEDAGLTTWNHTGYMILALAAVIRRNAHLLLTAEALERSLDSFKQAFPALTEGLDGRSDALLSALQTLLEDQVSIRDMYTISERVLYHEALQEEDPGLDLVSAVRRGLVEAIAHKLTRGTGTLVAYLVDPALEHEVEEAAADPGWPYTGLVEELGAVLALEMGHLPPTAQVPVILTRDEIRVSLRDALRVRHPRTTVVGYGDLPEHCNVQPVARLAR